MLKFSVLDQSPVCTGRTPADAVRETVQLAQHAEKMGYQRFWLAEHHNMTMLTSSTPEVLLAHIAAQTSTIRVGSGGVLLYHYSALKVAENFKMLQALYPGRIDLGIGRAPGGDYATSLALREGEPAANNFPQKLLSLIGFLQDEMPAGHPYANIAAMPTDVPFPELWLLGSSDQSAYYAAELGSAYSFAHFLVGGTNGIAAMRAYQDRFKPGLIDKPESSLGIFVICADTDAEAERLVQSRMYSMMRLESGKGGPVPSVEEVAAQRLSDYERAHMAQVRQRAIVGDKTSVKQQILAMQKDYNVDEFHVLTVVHDFEAKLRSYELLAEAFDFKPEPQLEAAARS
ncbi:LLM class flavin-dependent oxidoreductase [Tumebacillus sp. DT12]|uniref:LLM class flavin-dependent oxidoreductase n=1 Tax=Tumebacillus lacus TaxID=2995335 RepID=A0ABT3X1Y5_9BACL|nr:LLM class flavin-dependent oxidoreductase [Tumebacillus lacus]MCX7570933.1 LLM class flavin-dependent oxidoreductase [Tumebacillus lacus]